MNLTWHLIKKDFRRLRGPLALFSLLVAGKIVFYAYISGLFSTPDIEWLRRMQNGPEMLLRFLSEPVFAYLLVGWLVFEDSPLEQDAHWLTRPISGLQLFVAKLAGAGLMFVLLPVALNVLWWFACGVSVSEVLLSAGELAGMHSALVALGLACAALTGGFPRYILWSLIGVVVLGMAQLGFPLVGLPGPGLIVFLAHSGLAALAIAGHQFVTRRHRTSLALVGAGLLVVCVTSFAWQWAWAGWGGRQPAGERPEPARLELKLTGPARYFLQGRQHYAKLPVRVEGVPDKSAVARLSMAGDWSFSGKKAWTSNAAMSRPSLWREAIRRQLGFPTPAEPEGQVVVNLPFSLAMARRAVREPAALQARVALELGRGEILAELPLRESRKGAYAISYVSSGPAQETRRGNSAAPGPAPVQNAVSLLLTETSARGLQANSSMRMVATHFALVNRKTGEFYLNDPVRSGPEAIAVLNQAKVVCWRLTYLLESAPVRLDEMSFVILRFARNETVQLELKADPVPFAADSVPESTARPAGPDTTRMAELVRASAAGDRFMGSVLVAKGDAVLLSESAGWADVGPKAPNAADTRFRIGSLTKQFTAAAILLLEEDGRLKVDDPLARFVPDIPETWRGVTLRQLLTHTSGIPNFTDLPGFQEWRQEPRSPAETMALIRDLPLDFAPGEKFKYSNSGYVLLGWVVELASGRSYEAFLRERIFGPLGMNDSGCDTNNPPRPQHAAGYVPARDRPAPAFLTEMQGPGGAGVLYSTAPDLLRWTQGLFGGKLLKPASLEQMTTPGKGGYAFGIGVSTADGRKSVSHAGAIDGFVSVLSYYPEDKVTVALLANISGAPVAELGRQLADVAFGKTVILISERKEVAVPAAELQRLVGVYQLTPRVTTTIRVTDGQLTLQLTGQPILPLFPESGKKFFGKLVDVQVEFVTDDQGRVTHLLQIQGGRTQQAPRISDTVVERTAITLPRATLEAYVGVYELRPGLEITITLDPERDQLMAAGTGQKPAPMFAETGTKFFSQVVDVQCDFVKDASGAVTHLVLHQGGRDTPARRKP